MALDMLRIDDYRGMLRTVCVVKGQCTLCLVLQLASSWYQQVLVGASLWSAFSCREAAMRKAHSWLAPAVISCLTIFTCLLTMAYHQ